MKLELPYPPGVNTLYGVRATLVRGRPMAFPYKTHEHRDYAAQAKLAAYEAGLHAEQLPRWPKPSQLALEVRLFRPRRAGDIDGPLKTLLDVMQGVLFENDDQVAELHVVRGDDKERPRVELEVRELGLAKPVQAPLLEVPTNAPAKQEVPDEPWTTRVRRLARSGVVRNRPDEPPGGSVIPAHAALDPVLLERLLCRELGHRWVHARHGAPVTEFECCRRCGKIGDRL